MALFVFRERLAKRDFKKHFQIGATEKSHQLERDGERLRLLLEVQCDIRLRERV